MPWKELIRVALLGSDRTEIPDTLQETMQALGVGNQQDKARALLLAATKLNAQKKAGYIPMTHQGEWPSRPEHSEERFCSPESTRHLQEIMNGKYEPAQTEFFQLAKLQGRFLPPEQLPQLLQEASEDAAKLAVLSPLFGKHAHWLIAQHPEWSILFAEPEISDWASASQQERLLIFKNLRESDVSKSVQLLGEIWNSLGFRQKAAFLSAMESTVCTEDEILLEPALDDRRKEVRRLAQHLLTKISTSLLQKRTWERLAPLIQIKKSKKGSEKIIIILPEEISKEMLRDGLDPSQQWLRGGLKASRLAQMMAVVPAKKWEEELKKTPEELVALFAKSEYDVLLLQALSHSAALHQDDQWAISILAFWVQHNEEKPWDNFNPKVLYENLSAEAFNTVALPALLQCEDLPEEEDPITLFVRKNDHPWEETLAREFIIKCKEWIAQDNSNHWAAFPLKGMIQHAAYRIDPVLASSLTKSWPTSAPAWGAWESDIEQFFKILRFRQQMREALK